MAADPGQRVFDFNPIEATPEESERLRHLALQWTLEEAAEDFVQLPSESMADFYAAREAHLQALEVFGPDFPREPCAAWRMMQGQRRPPPALPYQLKLSFDRPKPNP